MDEETESQNLNVQVVADEAETESAGNLLDEIALAEMAAPEIAPPEPEVRKVKPPSIKKMVTTAIRSQTIPGSRKGCSFYAIKKFISENFAVDLRRKLPYIKRHINRAIQKGGMIRTRGIGLNGSFRIRRRKNRARSAASARNRNLEDADFLEEDDPESLFILQQAVLPPIVYGAGESPRNPSTPRRVRMAALLARREPENMSEEIPDRNNNAVGDNSAVGDDNRSRSRSRSPAVRMIMPPNENFSGADD